MGAHLILMMTQKHSSIKLFYLAVAVTLIAAANQSGGKAQVMGELKYRQQKFI